MLDKYHPQTPNVVPWGLIKYHESQSMENHDQSLDYINSRGGVDPIEFYAIYNDIKWKEAIQKISRKKDSEWLIELVNDYNLKADKTNGKI